MSSVFLHPASVLVIRGEPGGEDMGLSHPLHFIQDLAAGPGQAMAELKVPFDNPSWSCRTPAHFIPWPQPRLLRTGRL